MADPMLTSDLFLEGFPIKPEPISSDSTMFGSSSSAGVPIPQRRGNDVCDSRDFGFDMNNSSGVFPDNPYSGLGFYGNQSVWSPKSDIKMEDDDIFQVDKADLIQGPTLAELNANDDTLLGDLNFDDLVLPEAKYLMQMPKEELSHAVNIPYNMATSFPPQNSGSFFRDFKEDKNLCSSLKLDTMKGLMEEKSVFEELEVEVVPNAVDSSIIDNMRQVGSPSMLSPHSPCLSPCSPQPSPVQELSPRGVSPHKHTTLQSLLLKNSLQGASIGIPVRSNSVGNKSRPSHISRLMAPVSRLSSSAPTHLGLEQLWQRREPRPHLLSTSSLAEATSTSSISTGILSPEAQEFSLDEGFDSEDDTDHDEDDSSDAESSDGEGGSRSKKDKFFWQYNVQAKGPKGQRLILRNKLEDPHYLDEVTDPVFSPGCFLQGIKHSGKARKGDGNDLTPNPKKLSAIGKELDKLSRTINDMTPVNELPFDIRQKSRKEKNKLASRACRLKKKAQHEANKIKLFGLENEHKRLMAGLAQMKQLIVSRVTQQSGSSPPVQDTSKAVDKLIKHATKFKIAGQTTDFVNRTLDRLKAGIPNGGLEELQHHPT